ncbi:MAG: sugar phosphate isomerase/epimerase family protein [Vicinamibacterales bacterium]
MPRARRFGISSRLYLGQRLTRDHVREVAAFGFDSIELHATRTHVDYHSDAAIADLQGWLAETRLTLESVHAPVAESFTAGRWGPALNLASPDARLREQAVAEATRALQVARRLPFRSLVVHLGVEKGQLPIPGANNREAARRSIETLAAAAVPLGVGIAIELVPNELSRTGSLVHFVEEILEPGTAGICLDLGHARIEGDVADAIELVSEHVVLVHAHDNRGGQDEHLLPFDGSIDWPGALTSLQKVGYDGAIVLEPIASGTTKETLGRAKAVRGRMEQLLDTF